jgi:hypothetical protein
MLSNQRRNANLLPVAKLFLAFCLLLILGGGSLYYVHSKNDLHKLGEYQKRLERELDAVKNRNQRVLSRIATLSSYDALRKRQQQDREAFAKLIPVQDGAMVRVPARLLEGESDVRPVSNPQPAR